MFMKKFFVSCLLLLPLCLLILPDMNVSAQTYTMMADVIDAEGGEKTSVAYTLLDSMGRGIEGGEMSGGAYTLYAGFNGFAGEGLPDKYYVDVVNGDDGNTGESWDNATKTISKAI